CDVAAHRESGQGKPRRRRGQDAARHPCHAVIAGVVRNEEGAEAPELRKLLDIEARRTEKAGREHDGQRFRRHRAYLAGCAPRWAIGPAVAAVRWAPGSLVMPKSIS